MKVYIPFNKFLQSNNPEISTVSALNRIYPHQLMLPKEGIESVANLMQSLNIEAPKQEPSQRIVSVNRTTDGFSQGKAKETGIL